MGRSLGWRAQPSRCSPRQLPTYHYGSSRLGPEGLQHLPLYQEVGQEDDRGDFCDGCDSKGPLWKEMRAIGLPPHGEPRGSSGEADSPWASFGVAGGGTPGERSSLCEKWELPPWLSFGLSTEMLSTALSLKLSQPSVLVLQGPRLPSCAQKESCRGLQVTTEPTQNWPSPPTAQRGTEAPERRGVGGGSFFPGSQGVTDRARTGRPGLLLQIGRAHV